MLRFSVESGGDAAELFESGEASFDPIAVPIARLVVGPRLLATAGWNYRFTALALNQIDQFPTVIALVSQHVPCLQVCYQRRRLRDVVAIPTGQQKTNRTTVTIDRQMNLGAQSASGAPQSRVGRPPFPVAACACARTMLLSIIRYSLSRSRIKA